ncbi:vWA domain-containing protein [Yinghuangia seranimata]|uniref:vWA domain-containing protein n=1 Tax=Yinghuangia seranimata TaxID=408067 RepID=UPI00248CC53D|nr:VWA domain-containing protein [Yinghuangia seranimata]MDI2129825.1 VWA domain-containing protein [Yinghuangia seranimata]
MSDAHAPFGGGAQPAQPAFKPKGLPAYLVLDTSGSMREFGKLLNDTLLNIYDTLYTSPQMSEFIHLSVLSFNTAAHLVTPMTDIDELTSLPTVRCEGLSNFAPILRLVRRQIDADVAQLAQRGTQVLRPVVFLLTDGVPTDPTDQWEAALGALRDPTWRPRPHVITYGFGLASEYTLRRLATVAAFLAEPGGGSTGEALTSALTSLLNSLVNSARTRSLQVPEQVQGYKSVPLDFVEF